jgi:glyoxylase-like metal-dependent hydrolase (beta-lactamase superfamily II)
MSIQRYRVGGLEIVRAVELEIPLGPAILPIGRNPAALSAACDWARPHFVTEAGDVIFALSALGVVSEGVRVVIDPCCSFDLRRENPDIEERAAHLLDQLLPEAGFAPETVDLVVNTHFDGVGWNVRPRDGRWVPAFPNARHVWPRIDIDSALAPSTPAEDREAAARVLAPLLDAGLLDRVDAPHAVTSQISMHPSPGHTSGNTDIWIESGGESAVVVGDHLVNPLQCSDPDWTGLDENPSQSPGIRRALLQECAARDALMIGPHFGSPGAGRVRPVGDSWRLEALPASTGRVRPAGAARPL